QAQLKYRKFDKGYLDFMNASRQAGDREYREQGPPFTTPNNLPEVIMCSDRVVLPVQRSDGQIVDVAASDNAGRKPPVAWERWNDYGIGMLLAGKSQLLQAAAAFQEVEKLQRYDGPLNLARVLLAEGDYDGATAALQRAAGMTPPPPPWTTAWLSGEINREQGNFEAAAENFRSVLYDDTQERRDRQFDFSRDYRIRNLLGLTLIDLAVRAQTRQNAELAAQYLSQAESEFKLALKDDSENLTSHASLSAVYKRLGNEEQAERHEQLHLKYKADDNASDVARPIARRQYPAADHAAEQLVIYSLHRPDAYGLATNETDNSLYVK
ncbi:MAG: hypothetical protein IT423_00600, partial [Pirellulaceae bacterium]|nr:hypothetical protein [Pirellulaceae bacterium]